MPLTRKTQIAHAKDIGTAVAQNYYEDFSKHPEYRGPKFTWENFPDLVFRMAKAQFPLTIPHKMKQDIHDLCAKTAKRKAQTLVRKNKPT